jgi:hypothetical protein
MAFPDTELDNVTGDWPRDLDRHLEHLVTGRKGHARSQICPVAFGAQVSREAIFNQLISHGPRA